MLQSLTKVPATYHQLCRDREHVHRNIITMQSLYQLRHIPFLDTKLQSTEASAPNTPYSTYRPPFTNISSLQDIGIGAI